MFGSPQNYDNSPTEHGLIDTAKHPADHAKKGNSSFVSQVSKCMLETVLIWKAKQSLSHSCVVDTVDNVVDNTFSKLPNSPSFHVVFNDKGICIPRWIGKNIYERVCIWIQFSSHGLNIPKRISNLFFEIDEFYVHLEYVQNGVRFDAIPITRPKENGMIG